MKLLLDKDAELEAKNQYDETPLHLAACHGHTEAVKALIDKDNVELNIQNQFGNTALHLAAIVGHTEAVKALIDKDNVELNIQNSQGHTPLRLTVKNGNTEAAKLFISCTLRKDPKAQKPAFLEEPRYNELSRHFDARRAEI